MCVRGQVAAMNASTSLHRGAQLRFTRRKTTGSAFYSGTSLPYTQCMQFQCPQLSVHAVGQGSWSSRGACNSCAPSFRCKSSPLNKIRGPWDAAEKWQCVSAASTPKTPAALHLRVTQLASTPHREARGVHTFAYAHAYVSAFDAQHYHRAVHTGNLNACSDRVIRVMQRAARAVHRLG